MIKSRIDRCLTNNIDDDWDNFVSKAPASHYEQTSRWALIKASEGWRCARIKLFQYGILIAGTQVLYKTFRFIGNIGYINNGPVLINSNDKAKSQLLNDILGVSKNLNCKYIVVHPSYATDFHHNLETHGFHLNQGIVPPHPLTEATLLIDLSQNALKLMSEMRRTTRQKIKSSLKSGFIFTEGTRKDLAALFDLLKITCLRRGETPNPQSRDYLENIWDNFNSRMWVKLFLVRKGTEIICGGLIFPFGDTVRFWKYGWSGKYSELFPNYFLYWKLIEWSQLSGFRYFDIVQIEPQIADALKNKKQISKELKNHRIYGPTLFKIGFGGRTVEYPGTYYRFNNPFLRISIPFFLKYNLARLLTKRVIMKVERKSIIE